MRSSKLCQRVQQKTSPAQGKRRLQRFTTSSLSACPHPVKLPFLYFLGTKPFGSLRSATRLCYQHPYASEVCGREGVGAFLKLFCGSHLPRLCWFSTVLLQAGLFKWSKFKIILFRKKIPVFPSLRWIAHSERLPDLWDYGYKEFTLTQITSSVEKT